MGILLQALGLQPQHLEALDPTPAVEGDYSADVQPKPWGQRMSTERAVEQPAVLRSLQIISGMGSQLTLESERNGAVVTPRPALLDRPDPWRELDEFIERCLVNAATRGNNFLLKSRDNKLQVSGVEALDPRHVHIGRTKAGVKVYDAFVHGEWRHGLTSYEIEHVWGLPLPGHDYGLSPIGACRVALEGAQAVREYAANWFSEDNANTEVVLTTEQAITPADAKAAKRQWLALDKDDPDHGRPGPKRVRVMGKGLSAEKWTLSPADAQWLEVQNFGILDIARIFGVPPEWLQAKVEGSSLTYSSLPMINGAFLGTTLYPLYLRPLASALSRCLPRGQRAKFVVDELLKPDAKTQAEIDQIYLNCGVIGRQEIRDRKGWAGPPPAASDVIKSTPAPAPQETPA